MKRQPDFIFSRDRAVEAEQGLALAGLLVTDIPKRSNRARRITSDDPELREVFRRLAVRAATDPDMTEAALWRGAEPYADMEDIDPAMVRRRCQRCVSIQVRVAKTMVDDATKEEVVATAIMDEAVSAIRENGRVKAAVVREATMPAAGKTFSGMWSRALANPQQCFQCDQIVTPDKLSALAVLVVMDGPDTTLIGQPLCRDCDQGPGQDTDLIEAVLSVLMGESMSVSHMH